MRGLSSVLAGDSLVLMAERSRPDQGSPGRRPRSADRGDTKHGGKRVPPPPHLPDEVRVERVIEPNDGGGGKAKRSKRRRSQSDIDVSTIQFSGVPTSTSQKLQRRLAEAAMAFEAERFTESENLLNSIDRLAPGVAEVYELRGLTFYRLGRWRKAIGDFETFNNMTGSVEQHPVWADCARALKHWTKVDELWQELRDASPSAELVEEGRLVYAGGLADRGKVAEAIRLLEKAPKAGRRPAMHHLRRWYVLGDLYERTGDLARARRVFSDILEAESDFGDVAERVASLG